MRDEVGEQQQGSVLGGGAKHGKGVGTLFLSHTVWLAGCYFHNRGSNPGPLTRQFLDLFSKAAGAQ